MENNSRLVTELAAKKFKKYNNPPEEEKPIQINLEVKKARETEAVAPSDIIISQESLQEAIIWSEIIGKPLSKRRKRR